nr:DUF5818 domain-containing protein [Micromonospora sp. DSM 115978]
MTTPPVRHTAAASGRPHRSGAAPLGSLSAALSGVLLVVLLTAGCADGGTDSAGPDADPTGSATPSAPATAPGGESPAAPSRSPDRPPGTALPTRPPPTAPPKEPTDNQPTDRIAGRIVRGGGGPCYGLVTDDGTTYALHGPDVGPLEVGSYVRVTVAPLLLRIDCGAGVPRSIVTVEPV